MTGTSTTSLKSWLVVSLALCAALLHSAVADEGTCSATCDPNAACAKQSDGSFCCECLSGFHGNGENCFPKDDSIIVRGRVSAKINNIDLEEQEVHAYVHTLPSDARNYVAIGRVPPEVGSRISFLLPFTTPIHWLFAGDLNNNAMNGFRLTGGVFTRQSESTFFNEQGDNIGNLYISQNFTGLYENGKELRLESVVEARLPELMENEQVIYPDFNQLFEYKASVENPTVRKSIHSSGSINYKVTSIDEPSQLKSFRIEYVDRIHFSVCPGSMDEAVKSLNPSTKLSTKRMFVAYTQSEGQARFSSANYIKPSESPDADPCESNSCSVFAECVADQDSENGYYCQCKPGFDGDGLECQDMNECEEGSTYCSPIATCVNLLGHYECKCLPPRVGDGRQCEWADGTKANEICARCDPNARCITDEQGSSAYCLCNAGYNGNGYECQLEYNNEQNPPEYVPPTDPPTTTTTTTTPATTTRERLEHGEKCEACHAFASCELQYPNGGECCTCLEGYVGNGKYCFADASPITVNGKVSGVLNGQRIDDLDLYAYVLTHTSDSRNFVAIGKIPPNLGGSFQTLISIVNPINWLFAGRNGLDENVKVSNGFTTTGGLFSRTATLNFYDEAQRQSSSVTIRQEFQGLDPNNKDVLVRTEIEGNLPNIDPDAQIVFKDYKQEYIKYSKGFIRSNGQITYEVTSIRDPQSLTPYKIEYIDEITYNECPHLTYAGPSVSRVNSKRVFIRYTKGDNLLRFSSANFIYPSDAPDDPCEMNTCSIYAECVADSDSPSNYTCACKVGFEGDGINCYDVDECETGESDCDINAVCYNLVGHYECRCRSPYKGNGKECHYDLSCSACDLNAKCITNENEQVRCVCNPGWIGNGFNCKQSDQGSTICNCGENAECVPNFQTKRYDCKCKYGFNGDGYTCTPLPCNEYSNCNENARCDLTPKGTYECKCNPGFQGDGYKCSTQTCDILNNCGENARCVPDLVTYQHRCVCQAGYVGNGYQCYKDVQSCELLKNCHPNAECLFDEKFNRHFCRCKPGFTGDGNRCVAINSCRDRRPYEVCDQNADCIFDTKVNDFVCKCRTGYEGNGLRTRCYPMGEGPFGLHLVYAQGSSLHKIPFKPQEEDPRNKTNYNRIVYIPGQTAVGLSYDCHEQYVYWSDVSSKRINRVRLDGSDFSVVLEDVKSPEGLAIDWISRNIYFTDSEAKTIEVATLNAKKYRKVLIKSNLQNPRGIALDPIDGYIFWTDWNRKSPKIERANMDGTHRKVIVSEDIGIPNGLYFDQRRQEVCWADVKTKRIECVQKDGSNRRVVTQVNQMYPFDITEVGPNIYWSDWSRKEIPNVDKDGVLGQPIKLAPGGNGRVYGIVAIKNQCPRGTNACDRNNAECQQICLPKPDHQFQCACSDNSNGDCQRRILS